MHVDRSRGSPTSSTGQTVAPALPSMAVLTRYRSTRDRHALWPKATATKTKTDGDDNAFKVAAAASLLPREKTAYDSAPPSRARAPR